MTLFLKIGAIVVLCYFFSLGLTYKYEERILELEKELEKVKKDYEMQLAAYKVLWDTKVGK